MDANWYSSIAGVVAAAVTLGGLTRSWLGDVEGLNKVPLVLYVLAYACGLTLVAFWLGKLSGDLPLLVVDALTAAFLSVGVVSFASNVTKPLSATVQDAHMRRTFGKFAVALALLAAATTGAACATRSDGTRLSPEANVALRATMLVDALDALTVPPGSSPIERMVANKVLTRDEALRVAGVIRQTMTYAKDLGLTLEIVQKARTGTPEHMQGLQRASNLIRAISSGLANAPITVGTEAGRKAVVDLLAFSANLLLTVGSMFPAPDPGVPSAPTFEPAFLEVYAH